MVFFFHCLKKKNVLACRHPAWSTFLCLPFSIYSSFLLKAYLHTCALWGWPLLSFKRPAYSFAGCRSKAFETTFNRKVLNHFSTSDLFDHHFGFRSVRTTLHSTGDFLAFLTDSGIIIISAVSMKLLLLTQTFRKFLTGSCTNVCFQWVLSFSLYFYLIPSFFSDRSIAAVVDGQCSTHKPNNSGVLQGSILSPTLFLKQTVLYTHTPMTQICINELDSNQKCSNGTSLDRQRS